MLPVRPSQSTEKDGMADIEQVRVALAEAAEQSNATAYQIRAAVESTEQVLVRLRMAATGTGGPISVLSCP
ncbi:hypothetical protein Strop_1515 [Salinispora tropica CNB-440]|uniref:Uncharacterized protein n=2 Tax=Salinispora tropica TaxID=168695 RepID=A4X531_SALTO|nr:hypothetical protein Strop_1515 [Salinispora tropica CNB-440]